MPHCKYNSIKTIRSLLVMEHRHLDYHLLVRFWWAYLRANVKYCGEIQVLLKGSKPFNKYRQLQHGSSNLCLFTLTESFTEPRPRI